MGSRAPPRQDPRQGSMGDGAYNVQQPDGRWQYRRQQGFDNVDDFVPNIDARPGTDADRQNFEGLSMVITNAMQMDPQNNVAVPSAARTGQLRVAGRRPQAPTGPMATHYHARTTYRYNYLFITLYIFSVLASIAYFANRVIYISSGEMRPKLPANMLLNTTNGDITLQNLLDRDLGPGVTVGDEIPANLLETPDYRDAKEELEDSTYSFAWSTVVMAAEIGGFILVHLSQQMFIRQDTKFYPMPPETVNRLREICNKKGKLQKINIMVCTYNEPMETVKECVQHILDAPTPVYAQKVVYIGDDGAKKKFECSEQKRRMCEEFHQKGHTNVVWVGDRKSLPHQLNGKSSNINHMVLNKMFPHVTQTKEVPYRDVLMVMDCDHLVTSEFFAKACAVMLDRDVAVCLIPQAFHNEVQPDCFDNSNYNFMFRLMPYYFGAGCCFVTGTNVMIRARAAFEACRFDANPHGHETASLNPEAKQQMTQTLQAQGQSAHRQLFSETLVAEDIDLGSRVHTLGYKSVFLAEVLAKGEVPRGARDIWKQRSRWASAAHMYILDPDSVFWRFQPNMSFWQKSLYWIPMILHFTLIWAEPIMFTMPLICLYFRICPYGMDIWLWITHFFKLATTVAVSSYADTLELSRAAIYGQTMARVLFFVNVKAVLNTIMVYTGWKKPGAFKVTVKAGQKPAAKPEGEQPIVDAPAPAAPVKSGNAGPTIPKVLDRLQLHRIHDSLSKITEKRKACMPWEGTFDFWVLTGITAMNLFSVAWGVLQLSNKRQILSLQGCEQENIQLIALVFAFVEATPGLLFLMYMAVQDCAEWVMKIWVPLVVFSIAIVCILIEVRVGVQYIAGDFFGASWAQENICCGVNTDTVTLPAECAYLQG